MEKQIKLFLEFLENDKKLSSNTLQSYKRDITQYQEYIDKNSKAYKIVDNFFLNKEKYELMQKQIERLRKPNAAKDIGDLLYKGI